MVEENRALKTRDLHAQIYDVKHTKDSFLVALLPIPSIPVYMCPAKELTECAIIAANVDNCDTFSYVNLESDEKEVIGDALSNACAKMSKWYWCNLFITEPK